MFSLSFDVSRSIEIEKPVSEVFQTIANFKNWKEWSPWLCQEKDCPVVIEGAEGKVGHAQTWDGKRIGAGTMVLTEVSANKVLSYELNFTRPWKSKSKVGFKFTPTNAGTQVVWTMRGSLPIFLFFMKKMMSALVGGDYDRGLMMLKEYMETGAVVADTDFKGEKELPGFHYVGLKKKTSINNMPQEMSKDFEKLFSLVQDGKAKSPDQCLAFYHKYDMVNGTCEFTSAFAYKDRAESLGQGYEQGEISKHKSLQVVHTGPYKHLGNSWSAAVGAQRSLKRRPNKSIPFYEVYANNPMEVAPEQLVTEINIPIK